MLDSIVLQSEGSRTFHYYPVRGAPRPALMRRRCELRGGQIDGAAQQDRTVKTMNEAIPCNRLAMEA